MLFRIFNQRYENSGEVDVQYGKHEYVWPNQAELGVVDVDVAYVLAILHRFSHVKVFELATHLLILVHQQIAILEPIGLIIVWVAALNEMYLIGRLRYV